MHVAVNHPVVLEEDTVKLRRCYLESQCTYNDLNYDDSNDLNYDNRNGHNDLDYDDHIGHNYLNKDAFHGHPGGQEQGDEELQQSPQKVTGRDGVRGMGTGGWQG